MKLFASATNLKENSKARRLLCGIYEIRREEKETPSWVHLGYEEYFRKTEPLPFTSHQRQVLSRLIQHHAVYLPAGKSFEGVLS